MIHLKLTIMALLWGGAFVASKFIADQAGPFTITFLRFLGASIVMLGLVLIRGGAAEPLPRSVIWLGAGAGFIDVLCYNYFLLEGIKLVEAGRGSVIMSTVPIVVVLASYWIYREAITWGKVLGIAVSITGACVVMTQGHPSHILGGLGKGELMLLGCVLCAASFPIFSKKMMTYVSPLKTMTLIAVFGTILTSLPALYELSSQSVGIWGRTFWLNIFYLAIGPSVIAVIFFFDAIIKVGPSRASQYMNLVPVFAVVLSLALLNEQLSLSLLFGGGLVTTGLYLTNQGVSKGGEDDGTARHTQQPRLDTGNEKRDRPCLGSV